MGISSAIRSTSRAVFTVLVAGALIGSLVVARPTTASAATGDVFAWGVNALGQLGDGTTSYRTDAVMSGTSSTIDIAGGRHHVVAAHTDGTVSAWGWNGSSQLGNGSTTNQPTPISVNLSNVTAVGAGHYHSIAVRNSSVWTWGRNGDGQLGVGDTTIRRSPTPVPGTSNVTMVAGGREHSLALRSDGTMLAWGNNTSGQLGNGNLTPSSSPVDVAITNVATITSGRIHSAVLRTDGTVWTWGDNTYGQLGHGSTVSTSTPQQVAGLSGVVDIEAFGFHTIALDNQGRVWAWGRNNLGQLGDSTSTERLLPVRVGVPTATAIGSGRDYGMATTAAGVYAWGRNDGGEIGDGTLTTRETPVLVDSISDVVELVGGRDYIAARVAGDTPPPPPVSECTATAIGNDLRLDWADGLGRIVVRRNDAWFSTPGRVASTTIPNAAADDADYAIRVRVDGVRDVACDRGDTPPPPPPPNSPCVATAQAGMVELAWDPTFSRVNVRRNGTWLLTANTSSVTVAGSAADTFEIIVRPNGVKTTYLCT